jgi:hypothetical protein
MILPPSVSAVKYFSFCASLPAIRTGSAAKLVEHQRRLDARTAIGQLFADDALFQHIGAHAAILFGNVQVDQAARRALFQISHGHSPVRS